MEIGRVDPRQLVFVDKMATHTSLAPVYAYAPTGERAFFELPSNRALRTPRCFRASMPVDLGVIIKEVFKTYVEHWLTPELEPGQVVMMDNLEAHRPERVRQLIESRGCELLYLPPYSPDHRIP